MGKATAALAAILFFLTAQLPVGFTFSTAPAFLWSPNLDGKKLMVDYRVLSPRDMTKSALTDGGMREYLCSGEDKQHSKNFAFLFIGSELQSLDLSRTSNADSALVDLLKDSFLNSNLSLAFPYIAAGEEKVAVESSLISELADTCQHEFGIGSIALVGSCSVKGENFDKLDDFDSIHDYMTSRTEKSDGRRDLIVLCPGDSKGSDQLHSESSILSQLLNTVSQMGAKYSVLYISDPFRAGSYFSHQGLERFLAEGGLGNTSAKSTACDGVCQIKSSLLEGILVGIVLLVILISGLCCMMGIDTPTRFETPQDS